VLCESAHASNRHVTKLTQAAVEAGVLMLAVLCALSLLCVCGRCCAMLYAVLCCAMLCCAMPVI